MTVSRLTARRWYFGVISREGSAPAAARSRGLQVEERQLIERAQRGDHDAFAALLQRHQRRVFSLIANLLRRPAEVEDIAQQVFLKVYLALPRFDFRAAFATWLHRIVVNECYDHLRRRHAQKAPEGREVQIAETAGLERVMGAGANDLARRIELRQLVEQLFRRLSAEDRLLLTLREVEGFSVKEIAALVKKNENTVKMRLFRARGRLLESYRRFFAQQ